MNCILLSFDLWRFHGRIVSYNHFFLISDWWTMHAVWFPKKVLPFSLSETISLICFVDDPDAFNGYNIKCWNLIRCSAFLATVEPQFWDFVYPSSLQWWFAFLSEMHILHIFSRTIYVIVLWTISAKQVKNHIWRPRSGILSYSMPKHVLCL